jgi:hypothetical protein
MDTTTVLEIINMLNNQINHIDERENTGPEYAQLSKNEYYAVRRELKVFRKHLESFIEAELNAAENQTVE